MWNFWKVVFGIILAIALLGVLAFVLTTSGCCSCRAGANTDVLEYQREIDRLESTISKYDTAVRNATERLGEISDRSRAMEGTVDEVIELFDEYQRAVERIIRDYNEIRSEVESETSSSNDISRNTYNQNSSNDSRIYTLCKGRETSTMARYSTVGEIR